MQDSVNTYANHSVGHFLRSVHTAGSNDARIVHRFEECHMRFIWGSLLLVLAMVVSLIGLIDLGVFLLLGSGSTLSQHIADSIPQTAGAFLLTNGLSFIAGMLATHFTSFRMTPKEKK